MKRILPLVLMIFIFGRLFGEVTTTASLTALSGVIDTDSDVGVVSYLYGSVSFKSKGNRNVRANLQIDADISDRVSLDVSRAFVKVRFPLFRVTLGKTRVSWGEGFFFNAGDVIFEGVELQSDISGNSSGGLSEGLRRETAWLADVYIPLGAFSFLELTGLPFPKETIETASGSLAASSLAIAIMPLDFGRIAGRLVTKLLGVKLEGGALYESDGVTPYASIQGHFFLDWNASARLPIDLGNGDFTAGQPLFSVGAFGMWRAGGRSRLSFRLESRLLPDSLWEEQDTALPGKDPGYALFLYGELSLARSDSVNYYLRSLVSPIDRSALIFTGIDWNIYQGLNLMFQASAQVGDSNDIWGWERFGDLALLTGFRFKY